MPGWLRLDLGQQAGVAGDRVPDEPRPGNLPVAALVDEEHGPGVAGLVAFHRRHAGGVVSLLVVVRLDAAPGLLDDVGIHCVADVDLALLAEHAGRDLPVADVLDVPEHRPLHDLEDDHDPFADADILWLDVDELPAPVERADVLFDRLRVEDLAGPRDELRQFGRLGGVIALDAHLDDPVGGVGGGRCGGSWERAGLWPGGGGSRTAGRVDRRQGRDHRRRGRLGQRDAGQAGAGEGCQEAPQHRGLVAAAGGGNCHAEDRRPAGGTKAAEK